MARAGDNNGKPERCGLQFFYLLDAPIHGPGRPVSTGEFTPCSEGGGRRHSLNRIKKLTCQIQDGKLNIVVASAAGVIAIRLQYNLQGSFYRGGGECYGQALGLGV